MGNMRLKDKVALITGAASGIGQASALTFAQQGAKVVVVDIQQASIDETVGSIMSQGGSATGVNADVTDPTAVRRMVGAAMEAYGRLDILFNNAGTSVLGTILDIDEDAFDMLFAVNVKAVFMACKEAIPIMKAHGGGVILNTASQEGTVGVEGSAVYPATKGAVVQLTRCLALDHAADRIRVNCICPGPIDTPLLHWFRDQGGRSEASLIRNVPLNRLGTSQEMAGVAAFLCSDEASFITGSAIMADGGWTAR